MGRYDALTDAHRAILFTPMNITRTDIRRAQMISKGYAVADPKVTRARRLGGVSMSQAAAARVRTQRATVKRSAAYTATNQGGK